MHRETLSRSLLYSQNLLGKSLGAAATAPQSRTISSSNLGNSRTMMRRGSGILLGRHCHLPSGFLSPSTRVCSYHRTSSENTALPIVEAKSTSNSSVKNPIEDNRSSPLQDSRQKIFNLKASDILSATNDDPNSMFPSSSLSGLNLNEDKAEINPLDSRINRARSAEELLSLSSESHLTLKHSCQILSRLGNIVQSKNGDSALTSNIRSDRRFLQLFNLIQRGNHSQFPHHLLQALSGLQKLGLENSSEVIRLVERELSWSMRRCPLKFLARSINIINNSSKSSLFLAQNQQLSSPSSGAQGTRTKGVDESIVDTAIKVLHRRWIEAITGSDFISLFQIIDVFDDDRKLKIDERAADVAHQFNPMEIVKLFVVLGRKKRRPTPLLRSLAFHYSKSNYKCPTKEAIELIYSLNELTFAEPLLMNKLCEDISEDILQIKNASQISSLMTSLGQMRYKHKEILLAVDEWIMKRLNSLRPFDYAAWLQASATLNHTSQNLPSFCKAGQEVLTQSTVSSPVEWVNVVHSFATLNQLKPEMLNSVLNSKFVDSIEKLGLKSTKQKVKLLQLNFLASKLTKYTGPLLPSSSVKDWSEMFVNSSDEKLSKVVVDSLATFLPPQKYLELNTSLESGVFVDATCFIDSKLMPVTLQNAKNSKPDQEPAQKVAFVVEGYSSMCLGLKHPTGQASLNQKILETEGYLVINVPYTEFGINEKLVRRVQYLEQKLKSTSQTYNNTSESVFPGGK